MTGTGGEAKKAAAPPRPKRDAAAIIQQRQKAPAGSIILAGREKIKKELTA